MERTPSIRLSVVEHGPLETSTPQGDDLPSPVASQTSANTVLILTAFLNCKSYAHVSSFTAYCLFILCIPHLQDDSRSTPSQRRSPIPSIDRLAQEWVSKRSTLSLDLNANENGVSEQSGSESLEEGERMPHSCWRELELMRFMPLCFNIFFFLCSLGFIS